MRFNGMTIPQGATIVNAHVQFQVDEVNTVATSLTIEGEDVDNAATFTTAAGSISSRPRTTAAVPWSPVPWTATGQAGPDQQTPGIASVIQEIVNRPSWSSGNSIVIIITGTGERTAESFDGNQSQASPLLHVEYAASGGNTPPIISDIPDQTTLENTPTGAIGFTVGDAETLPGNLTVSASSSDMTLVPNGNIVFGGSGANRTLTITPAANQTGTTTITVTVTDEGSLTAMDTFVLTVTAPNTPPHHQ